MSQSQNETRSGGRYEVGQVWTWRTRPGEEDSRLIIVKTTDLPEGRAYSIFLEGIKLDTGSGETQESLPHAPVSAEVLDASVMELVETREQLPDFEWAWQEWRDEEGGVFSIPVAEILDTIEQAVATTDDPFPAINWSIVEDGAGLEQELAKEVGQGHVLCGVSCQAIARANYNDDILVQLPESGTPDGARYAVVHLTWSGKPEEPPWPSTELFPDFQSWYEPRLVARKTENRVPSPAQSPRTSSHVFGLTKTTWALVFVMAIIIALAIFFLQ
ncbi:MAG: hypothetical protein ACR2NP_03065 [Pirellulaceae bacterium]